MEAQCKYRCNWEFSPSRYCIYWNWGWSIFFLIFYFVLLKLWECIAFFIRLGLENIFSQKHVKYDTQSHEDRLFNEHAPFMHCIRMRRYICMKNSFRSYIFVKGQTSHQQMDCSTLTIIRCEHAMHRYAIHHHIKNLKFLEHTHSIEESNFTHLLLLWRA